MSFKDFSNSADNKSNNSNNNGQGNGMPIFIPGNKNNNDDATEFLINYNEEFKANGGNGVIAEK